MQLNHNIHDVTKQIYWNKFFSLSEQVFDLDIMLNRFTRIYAIQKMHGLIVRVYVWHEYIFYTKASDRDIRNLHRGTSEYSKLYFFGHLWGISCIIDLFLTAHLHLLRWLWKLMQTDRQDCIHTFRAQIKCLKVCLY